MSPVRREIKKRLERERSPTGVNPQKKIDLRGKVHGTDGENGGVGSCSPRESVLRESKALYIERTPEGKKRRERKRKKEREHEGKEKNGVE